jgi:hypothetical protein
MINNNNYDRIDGLKRIQVEIWNQMTNKSTLYTLLYLVHTGNNFKINLNGMGSRSS